MATRVTNLRTSRGMFCKTFKVDDDGGAALATGLLAVELPGFEPDAAHGNSRVGFVPNADLIRVQAITDSADAAAVYSSFDRDSFIKKAADATNTIMQLTLYNSAKVYAVIIEIPV